MSKANDSLGLGATLANTSAPKKLNETKGSQVFKEVDPSHRKDCDYDFDFDDKEEMDESEGYESYEDEDEDEEDLDESPKCKSSKAHSSSAEARDPLPRKPLWAS